MNNLYHFSPIESEKDLSQVWNYLTSELEKLSRELLFQSLPITTLKVFAHYPEEYYYLYNLISEMGPKASFSSDTSLYVQADKKINGQNIKYLGVRIVDPYRLHVGCGDYELESFEQFKKRNTNTSQFVRSFRDDMVELWHPDFDVLGYVVPVI